MTRCVNKELGRYEVLGAIHRGGMGEILLVRARGAEGFSRKLVLKGILPELADDPVSTHLFRREAKLMASLEHPNIVRVFDVPEIKGVPYLAMEYVRGRNVHQLIQASRAAGIKIPLRIAAHIIAEVLRGLHFAHRAKDETGKAIGIVHRDISPGNILLSFFGEVKVTDFGIAKIADTPRITAPRSIRGKARYTAPETIRNGDCTVLSDVYAAAVVLSEMLLGEALFSGENLSQTLLRIISEPRENLIGRVLASTPKSKRLDKILARSLDLSPKARFRSAIDFCDALGELCWEEGGPVTASELGEFMRQVFPDADDAVCETHVSSKTPCAWMGKFRRTPPPPPPIDVEETGDLPQSAAASSITCDAIKESDAIISPVFASLLMEPAANGTDEEVARQIEADADFVPPPRSGMSQIEAKLWAQPVWLLIVVGVSLGALTAVAGAFLGLLTAGG
jgi:serine/threonine protein kinase